MATRITQDDYLASVLHVSANASRAGWCTRQHGDPLVAWTLFYRQDCEAPEQGWKIHISCAAVDAPRMIRNVGSALLQHRSPFKFPNDIGGIVRLNSGAAGETQIGKIITVYPENEDALCGIAETVGRVWPDRRGPHVASDVALNVGGRVSARYGAFRGSSKLNSCGRTVHVVLNQDGTEVEDTRRTDGAQHDWAPSLPSKLLGTVEEDSVKLAQRELALDGRLYLPIEIYTSKPGSWVALAVDSRSLDVVLVKRARVGVGSDLNGYDALDRLRNEFAILRRLGKEGIAGPSPIACRIGSDLGTVVTSALNGRSLAKLDRNQQIISLPRMAAFAADMHSAGFAHRDIKLENALLVGDEVVFVDYELSASIGCDYPIVGGSPGHVPPEGPASREVVAADLYALGATIFRVLTGLQPAKLPTHHRRERMIGLLASFGYPDWAELVGGLTTRDPSERHAAKDAATHLRELTRRPEPARRRVARRDRRVKRMQAGAAQTVFEMAAGVSRTTNVDDESLGTGAAGVVFSLRSAACATGSGQARATEITKLLAARDPSLIRHGLFTGNSGVALVLAIEGKRVRDQRLIDAAKLRLAAAARSTSPSWDLYSGRAGYIWAVCAISRVLDEGPLLEFAAEGAEGLGRSFQLIDGVPCWPSHPDYDRSRNSYYGAAHGSAGIGLALATWGAATGDGLSLQLASDIFVGLRSKALASDGFTLLGGPGRAPTFPAMWCHGTIGLLWAAMQAAPILPSARDVLEQLSSTSQPGSLMPSNASLCHGQAGVIDALRGLAALGIDLQPGLMDQLISVIRLSAVRRDGWIEWPAAPDEQGNANSSLMTGGLGTAISVIMLHAEIKASALSLDWIAECAGSGEDLDPLIETGRDMLMQPTRNVLKSNRQGRDA